jgi:molybdate transport system permease protein
MIDLTPILLSLKLASITTFVLFVISIPIAYWLAYSNARIKLIVETLISMPLVLPPTVIGFYLLLTFSPNSALGLFLEEYFNLSLLFSFQGLVFASVIYSLPFMVNPMSSGFSSIPKNIIESSRVLGKSNLTTLFRIILPNSVPSLLSAVVLSFAHTIGEFGVVLMIGGNIPKETRVASIAIYDQVESLNYGNANTYSIILICITFIILLSVYIINGKKVKSQFL